MAVLGLLGSAARGAELAVRVRIVDGLAAVTVGGSELEIAGRPARSGELELWMRGGELRWPEGRSRRAVVVRGRDGVRVEGRAYPGRVAIVPVEGDRLDVVNEVPLERYVSRSVTAEVYSDWPAEALKAQAVAARTYALYRAREAAAPHYDLESSVMSQRYAERPASATAGRASRATRGEYLSHAGEPILAVFHAAAGGRTASSAEVWGRPLPYLRSVPSPDSEAPDHFWSYAIPLADLSRALRDAGVAVRGRDPVRVTARTPSGRAAWVRVAEVELTGRELRAILGGRALRSALYEVRVRDGEVSFLGSGAGHGVGLSQWGARELARRGRPYTEILAHYYPRTALRRLEAVELATWRSR